MHSAWFLVSGFCLGISLMKLATNGLSGWAILTAVGMLLLVIGSAIQYDSK